MKVELKTDKAPKPPTEDKEQAPIGIKRPSQPPLDVKNMADTKRKRT